MNPLHHLDWEEIIQKIASYATSGAAKIKLSQTQALDNKESALQAQKKVFYAIELLQLGQRPFFESLDLFENWYSRVKKNAVLKVLEIKDVRSFCLELLALKQICLNLHNPWTQELASTLMQGEEPLSAIDQIITAGGEIRSDASEKLYRLYKEKENLIRQVQNALDKLVHAHEMTSILQDKYVTTREGRWVLPVRSGMQHSLSGVIHGSSQTKQTVFMEPEDIIPQNNRIRQIDVEIEEEIERLLTELSNYLYSIHHNFETSRNLMVQTDALLAKAQWSLRIDAKAISFSEDQILLNEVKHPLLVLSDKDVIANSVQLTPEKRILLLSGPNAGGKTVLLKSIGLAAQMARCGLPACCGESSELPFFKDIVVGIGDSQNVGEELSTFAAHLKVLNSASQLSGSDSLVLIDEICGATDPEEGSALARAFIERLAANKVFSIITSHLSPLKSGWKPDDTVLNGSMEYDSQSGRPSYQFLQGIAGDSLALQTAKRVGVDSQIVERALELLTPETRLRLSGLEEIEQLKSDINQLREHLKKEQNKTKHEKSKYEALISQFNKEKNSLLEKALKSAEKKIEELITQTKVEDTFRRHRSLSEIQKQLPEIVKAKSGLAQTTSVESSEEFGQRFPPGTKVFVPSLGQDGIVQSIPNKNGEVMILSGSIRLNIKWSELKPPQKSQNPTADILRRSGAVTVSLHDQDRTLDLRGKTVDEALSELEICLDQAAQTKEDRIKVIHGHGTEALKKAVRTYLSRSVYVKKWKAGSPEQGGDGVTWVEISDD